MSLRGWLGVAAVLAVVAVAGVGGATATAQTLLASSPCRTTGGVATWSPNGKQIAFVGYGVRSAALCVADAEGSHARPLGHATCSRRGHCPLINYPTELFWVRPKLLLYADWAKGIFAVPLAGKPKRIGVSSALSDALTVDVAGDRVAYGAGDGPNSHGPVRVLSVPSGRTAGKIGGPKTDWVSPSLSPGGKQVAFVGGQPTGVWTASAKGRQLQQLKPCHSDPVWSPTGKWIACLSSPQKWPSGSALLLVSPQSHASITVVRPSLGVTNIFGWSPNGVRIAFSAQNSTYSRLDVVNLATDKVRQLLSPSGDYVAWSPDSQQLLVTHDCRLRQVPVEGSKKSRRLLTPAASAQC